jgi:hypothetical protein
MSSGAAQLPSHRGGRRRRRGAVVGLPSAADAATRASFSRPAGRSPSSWPSRMSGRRPRRSSRCPPPPSACGRTSVRCPRVRCPRDRCPRDRCPRDRGDPGVRTDRRPVSAAAAAALSAPRWILRGVGVAGTDHVWRTGRRVAVVGERLGGRRPNRAWRHRDGRTLVVRGSHKGRRQAWAAASQVHRLRRHARRLADRGELVQRQVPVGWRGAGEGAGAPSPRRFVLGRLPACWPTWAGPGGSDHAAWSVRWWWSGVVQLREAIRFGGGAGCGRSAAAVGEERCPLEAVSALTSENSGGRDRV